ncbi:ABC transporter ATP-binding protein (plasmid) [Haloferax mediterranei ATCC 33500]|uniref:ABC transporter ATP-binding protein n=1 Tax=Haloferax mediterranei (strain ATCC 33500 / DSM 1411 / JCM 8866 / NBRC 14739 / NCIMB 2177 / R-4) TaxID=523841 RepID=I3R9E1_HALMT|nr:ABC transporter ATP-binding protein [Haloferax mediterranei]AFK20851.1 ABC-type transport system ATP-binding protein [Haloferax mediterranei ATCC 33500]AHZ24275.1 ABC transporter ATP-binding protein [Haloferax mediterranei ATCC 33500]EMA05358.1 ABC-type transport system ATP-binding protein [Haloferax mediterranei ATCC 33500]MDX5989842.1 ABC transporter ATP-binding protein [Haloferax mediterranei ATCC 33500]QCQ77286.1 ABC transporter ATP-binding protein [Haloferax mediterranei ATCC 33500]
MSLTIQNLGKQYTEDVWGVRNIDLELDTGVHGLLGPNGAGKSSLMRMITTVMEPTKGSISWNGTDVLDSPGMVRSVLGYLPQDFGVYPDLTLEEFLEYVGALRSMDSKTVAARIDELVALTNLEQARDRKLKTFSGGMRQRAGIAQALLNDPGLLVVDEPTVGLDPEERVRFRNIISDLSSDRVVILSTHIVPDIEATANTIALLDDGKLLTHTDPESLIKTVEGKVYTYTTAQSNLDKIRSEQIISGTVSRSDGVELRVIAEEPPHEDARIVQPTLEDAYLWRVGPQVAR